MEEDDKLNPKRAVISIAKFYLGQVLWNMTADRKILPTTLQIKPGTNVVYELNEHNSTLVVQFSGSSLKIVVMEGEEAEAYIEKVKEALELTECQKIIDRLNSKEEKKLEYDNPWYVPNTISPHMLTEEEIRNHFKLAPTTYRWAALNKKGK